VFVEPYWGSFGWKGPLPFPEGVTEDGAPWIGARDPKLTLDEYTDYGCPHCRAATAWTLRRLAKRPQDIRLVRRQFPLAACRASARGTCQSVRMAHCAAEQQRFWQMDRWLFARGDERTHDVKIAARDVGLDVERFATCTERQDVYEWAEANSRTVAKRHLLGTPTYMVRGKRITPAQADELLARGSAD
jgi:protein-disulfide isomerase